MNRPIVLSPMRTFCAAAVCALLFFSPGSFGPTFAQAKPEVKCANCKVSNMTVSGAWKQCDRCGKWYCPSCQGGKSRLECCMPTVSGIKTVCSSCGVTSHQVSGNWRKCSQCGKKYCHACQKGSTASPCCKKTLELIP